MVLSSLSSSRQDGPFCDLARVVLNYNLTKNDTINAILFFFLMVTFCDAFWVALVW